LFRDILAPPRFGSGRSGGRIGGFRVPALLDAPRRHRGAGRRARVSHRPGRAGRSGRTILTAEQRYPNPARPNDQKITERRILCTGRDRHNVCPSQISGAN
jgi:hypothetical protein